MDGRVNWWFGRLLQEVGSFVGWFIVVFGGSMVDCSGAFLSWLELTWPWLLLLEPTMTVILPWLVLLEPTMTIILDCRGLRWISWFLIVGLVVGWFVGWSGNFLFDRSVYSSVQLVFVSTTGNLYILYIYVYQLVGLRLIGRFGWWFVCLFRLSLDGFCVVWLVTSHYPTSSMLHLFVVNF